MKIQRPVEGEHILLDLTLETRDKTLRTHSILCDHAGEVREILDAAVEELIRVIREVERDDHNKRS